MITPPDKRVVNRTVYRARSGSNHNSAAPPVNGPDGSSLCSFFCIFQLKRMPTSVVQQLFSKSTFGSTGWIILINASNQLEMGAGNSVPSLIRTLGTAFTQADVGKIIVGSCCWNNGTASGWLNTTATTPVSSGAGYTGNSVAVSIGVSPLGVTTQPALDVEILACAFVNAYNVGPDIATVVPQWQEDMQQGRYLTPIGGAPNASWSSASSWYWDARDVTAGAGGTKATWTDRGPNAVVLNRTGVPQTGIVPSRF